MRHAEEEILGKAYDHRLARRLLGYLRPYKGVVAISVFLLILVSATRLLPPYLTQIAIDQYIRESDMSGLAQIALLYLLILLIQFFLSFAQTYLT
ncbi:MAG TPA: ABC transporter transmembrane domain-containing protein, partial [Acidobacteriota bacterium]|nr:ABC transporter transmembrane domain-containing protein [Acidobacteriota bacterium]